ncbi:MAG: hypothetical protein P8X91_08440 [Candidatus Bathyarchaeota archaeon]
MQFVCEKPVLTFYKERFGKPETEPFVAVKARKIIITKTEKIGDLDCVLENFFPIMGCLDYITSKEGKSDSYVLCWFDDSEDNFNTAFRRMTGVTFNEGIECTTDEKGKITCNCRFKAKNGKLK